jgi:hypothetical protein
MRKEIIFAILAGLFFGIILAFGVWRANSAIVPQTEEQTNSTENIQEDNKITELTLTLAKPEDFDVITESPTIINGITKPNSWVIISGEDEDFITKSDVSGNFETEVDMVGGINRLLIHVRDGEGNSVEKELTLVYSSEIAKQIEE